MSAPTDSRDPARGGPSLGEFGRIERFFRPLSAAFAGAAGLTDDAALVAVPPGRELVVTTDAIVEGVHFLPDDAPGDIARKALRVNLSDLAAKGATPMAYLLTLALRRDIGDEWVARFAEALGLDQAGYGILLAGGDSVSTQGPLWVSITALGLVDAGRIVRRSGARPGDLVFVTGTIGDAAFGLAAATGRLRAGADDIAYLLSRYREPRPRCALAPTVARHATASLDVSDGLAADFAHLCRASNVDGAIEADLVPLSPAARRLLEIEPERLRLILGGGDDYEILFTAAAESAGGLAAASLSAKIDITCIGRVGVAQAREGRGRGILVDRAGAEIVLDMPGWTHR